MFTYLHNDLLVENGCFIAKESTQSLEYSAYNILCRNANVFINILRKYGESIIIRTIIALLT